MDPLAHRVVRRFLAGTLQWEPHANGFRAASPVRGPESPIPGFYFVLQEDPWGWETFWAESAEAPAYGRVPILANGHPRTTGGARRHSYLKTAEEGKQACEKHLKLLLSKEEPTEKVKLTPAQKRFILDVYEHGEPDAYNPMTNRMLGPLKAMGLFQGWRMTDRGKQIAEQLKKSGG